MITVICFYGIQRSAENQNLTYRELTGHNGFVRSIAFTRDEKFLATAGRDSSVIIWDTDIKPVPPINSIKTRSGIRAMVFCSTDTLIIAQEDGSIILWNIKQNENTTLYSSETEKPLCLAWNDHQENPGCRMFKRQLFCYLT